MLRPVDWFWGHLWGGIQEPSVVQDAYLLVYVWEEQCINLNI